MYNANDIKVTKAESSKRGQIDLENPGFGKFFTDHMFVCDYKDGQWQNPEIKPYESWKLDPSSKIFHYGQSVFEGMKAFKDKDDKTWLFRPDQNFKRLNTSCVRMAIPEFPEAYFFEALEKLVKMEHEWINNKEGYSLYIRPFVLGTQNNLGASPSTEYRAAIICSPVKAYYAEPMKVLVQERYSRSANGGVGFVKAGGNYGASFYPTGIAQKKGYGQVIWTDANTHEYLEEAGTMNVFFRIKDTLLTAPTGERILDGVTRKSLIQLAQDNGFNVEVRPIKVQEITEAAQKGDLKEIFGAGTAVTVVQYIGFGYNGQDYALPEPDNPYGLQLKKKLQAIQYNKAADRHGWRYDVK